MVKQPVGQQPTEEAAEDEQQRAADKLGDGGQVPAYPQQKEGPEVGLLDATERRVARPARARAEGKRCATRLPAMTNWTVGGLTPAAWAKALARSRHQRGGTAS